MQQEWLTLSEAAERLGISVQTARRWVRDGKLPAEQHAGTRGPEYRVRADAVPGSPAPLPTDEPPANPSLAEPPPPAAEPLAASSLAERSQPPAAPSRAEPAPSSGAVAAPAAVLADTPAPSRAATAPPALPRPLAATPVTVPRERPPALPSPEAVELAAGLASLRAEVRAATRDQAVRESALRAELEKTRTELSAALEALRQTRETVADLHRQLEDRDRQLESKTRALVAARRQVAVRESGRLNVLRENLQEGQRPWWRRLKGKEKE